MLILLLCSSNECWMSHIQVAEADMLQVFHICLFTCATHRRMAANTDTEWKGQYGQDVTLLVEGSKLNRQKWAFQNLYPSSSCKIQVIYSCVLSFSLSFPISALHRSLSLSFPRVAIIKVFPVTSVARGSYRCPFGITQSLRSCWPATNWQTQACTLSQRAFGFRLHTPNTHDVSRKTHRWETLFW